ncbi:MAG: DUF167 domain-containing protein [Actinomycetota bacterium]|nr:DUF167 domain-containing protein [Actinomycetota bacterium]
MSRGSVAATKGGTLLNLRVSPGAKSAGIEGPYGESEIKVRVAAPPVDGKANAEVERLLAELLGVARSDISVIRGSSSRDKTLLVHSLEPAEVRSALDSHLG